MKTPLFIKNNKYYYSVDLIHNLTIFYSKIITQKKKYIFFGKTINIETYHKCFIININLNHYIKDYEIHNSLVNRMINDAEQAYQLKMIKITKE